jgi:hypothetical protein
MGGVSGPEGLPVYVNGSGELAWTDTSGTEQILSTGGSSAAMFKSYSVRPGATNGTYWLGGYYEFPAADSNLTQAGTTQTLGSANVSHAAHASLIAGGAGTATGGSGAVTIVVSGTSITDAAVRTTSDTEVIVSDITTMTTDAYYETSKKWIGQVTYTLTVGATGHTAYAADFNYGFSKYEDFGNRDFTVTDFECVANGGASDTGLNISLFLHSDAGWTYDATAFAAGGTKIADMNTDHSTEQDSAANEVVAYKRAGLSQAVTGTALQGVVASLTTTQPNAVTACDMHVGVQLT